MKNALYILLLFTVCALRRAIQPVNSGPRFDSRGAPSALGCAEWRQVLSQGTFRNRLLLNHGDHNQELHKKIYKKPSLAGESRAACGLVLSISSGCGLILSLPQSSTQEKTNPCKARPEGVTSWSVKVVLAGEIRCHPGLQS